MQLIRSYLFPYRVGQWSAGTYCAWAAYPSIKLDTLNATVDPEDKLRSLLRQLDSVNSSIADSLSQNCRDTKKTFEESISYLKEYATREENMSTEMSETLTK